MFVFELPAFSLPLRADSEIFFLQINNINIFLQKFRAALIKSLFLLFIIIYGYLYKYLMRN